MAYFLHRNSEKFGPYTAEELRKYKEEGLVLGSDPVTAEGTDQKVSVDDVLSAIPVEPLAGEIRTDVRAPAQRASGKRRWGLWLGAFGLIAVIVVAIAIGMAIAAARAPERSLEQARMAYINRDGTTFDQYVDVQSVLSDWTDQAVEVFLSRTNAGPVETLAERGLLPYVKNAFLPAASQSVERFIISGTLSDDAQAADANPTGAFLAKYVSDAMRELSTSQLTYGGVESQSISGDGAVLDVRVASAFRSEPLIVKVRMRKVEDRWKVVAIPGLAGLVNQLAPPSSAPPETPPEAPPEAPAAAVPAVETPPATDTAPDFDSLPMVGATPAGPAPAGPEESAPTDSTPSASPPVADSPLIDVRVCVPQNLVQNESWDNPQSQQMAQFRQATREYISAHANGETAFRIRDALPSYDPVTTYAGDLVETLNADEACGDGYEEYTLKVNTAQP